MASTPKTASIARITNQASLSYKLGMRRKVRLSSNLCWYFKKGTRCTMMHRLFVHGFLERSI